MDKLQLEDNVLLLPTLVALVIVSLTITYILTTSNKSKEVSISPAFLNNSPQDVILSQIIEISHDVKIFRFALPDTHKNSRLGLPVGKHFKIFAPNANFAKKVIHELEQKVENALHKLWNNSPDPEAHLEIIERKYTPTSSDSDLGFFDLCVKVYHGNQHPRFPDGGKMSQYLNKLSIGDKLTISGPWGLNEYLGHGQFLFRKQKFEYKNILMIAGGTGITPMFQIINAVLNNPADKTNLFLLFANKSIDDILLRNVLDEMSMKHSQRFRVHYTLDEVKEEEDEAKKWRYSKGFVNSDMIQTVFPKPSEESVVLLCGPPPMIKFACKPSLEKLGYDSKHIREF